MSGSASAGNDNDDSGGNDSAPPPPPRLVIGLDCCGSAGCHSGGGTSRRRPAVGADAALARARPDGYDFVTTAVCFHDHGDNDHDDDGDDLRTDVTALDSRWWRTSVAGVLLPEWDGDDRDPSLSSSSSTTTTTTTRAVDRLERCLGQGLPWSAHVGLPAVLLPPLEVVCCGDHNSHSDSHGDGGDAVSVAQYAAAVARHLHGGNSSEALRDLQLWVPLRLGGDAQEQQQQQQFDWFYSLLNGDGRVRGCLVLEPVPSSSASSDSSAAAFAVADWLRRLHGWIGAVPIAGVVLPTDIFLTNRRGFPTLSRAHQVVLAALLRRCGRTVKVLVRPDNDPADPNSSPSSSSATQLLLTAAQKGRSGALPHLQYLQHFRRTRAELVAALDSEAAHLETDYLDQLQAPLQPLGDHLENATYEVFERDPVKYARYQEAVERVLHEHFSGGSGKNDDNGTTAVVPMNVDAESGNGNNSNSSSNSNSSNGGGGGAYNILVVGAGRGPLVDCCLRAIQKQLLLQPHSSSSNPVDGSNRRFRVVAVEKNPSAVLYLRSKLRYGDWRTFAGSAVSIQVVQSDLRRLTARRLFGDGGGGANNEKAHLVVSELLGSFGCNELSPECLDALLLETDACDPAATVSVPARYTCHAAPVASAKLHQEALLQALHPDGAAGGSSVIGLPRAVETPYVVRAHAASQMHASLDCWSFEHPPPPATRNNNNNSDTGNNNNIISGNNHERYANLQFPNTDPSHAAATGSGYGGVDESVAGVTAHLLEEASSPQSPSSSPSQSAAPLPYTCTGLLGTFTADLYGSSSGRESQPPVRISTAPQTFSTGMFSWFPLYFPLQAPVRVPAGATLRAQIWRRVDRDARRVWYEWSVQVWQPQRQQQQSTTATASGPTPAELELLYASPIHNPGGRSYHVAM